MNKYVIFGLVGLLVIPQIAFASWWNPFSWFNNWSFSEHSQVEDKTEMLEKKVQELEEKLNAKSPTIPETDHDIAQPQLVKSLKNSLSDQINTPPFPQQSIPVPSIPVLDANAVRCTVSKSMDIHRGDLIRVTLSDLTAGISAYDIVWNKDNLVKIFSFNEATFRFDNIGAGTISAMVTRKSDGAQRSVNCLTVNIPCDNESCLNNDDKKLLVLNSIMKEIDSWYDVSQYPNLSVTDRCFISESIIRSFEYKYGLLGGENLPTFSPNLDCANSVAPASYKYKIQLLIDSL